MSSVKIDVARATECVYKKPPSLRNGHAHHRYGVARQVSQACRTAFTRARRYACCARTLRSVSAAARAAQRYMTGNSIKNAMNPAFYVEQVFTPAAAQWKQMKAMTRHGAGRYALRCNRHARNVAPAIRANVFQAPFYAFPSSSI